MYQDNSTYNGPVLNERYVLLTTLGDGHTSNVYKARDLKEDCFVAVKIIKKQYLLNDSKAMQSITEEVTVMKMLDHPNIVKLVEFGEDGKVVGPMCNEGLTYIVMEYIEGVTLFDLWNNYGKPIGEQYGRFLMLQLIDALEYMLSKGTIHRDLKPENIIIDNSMNVKLLDFGFAAHENIDNLTAYYGTQTYMAPEIKKKQEYKGTEVDIFSLGVVVFSMVRGLWPFNEAKRTDIWYDKLCKGQSNSYWNNIDMKNTLSAEFKDLIVQMFAEEGSQRPTYEQIRQHAWMTNGAEVNESLKAGMCMELLGQKYSPPSNLVERCDSPKYAQITPQSSSISVKVCN